MLSSEPYLYYSVVIISNVLKLSKSNQANHNNYYYVTVKTGQADSSGSFSNTQDTKQCCHFFYN